jgi:hypothetical protein
MPEAKATPETANALRLVVDSKKWLIARLRPAQYGDMGGGFGTDVTSRLKENGISFVPFNGAAKASGASMGGLKFYNARAEAWWRFREELNPDREGGAEIALSDDPELLADLTAPTFEVRTGGIQIESKDDIRKRLGRSTNKGDAAVMALAPGNQA